MPSKLAASAAILSLCFSSATPALAQDYRSTGFQGSLGANATLNLRVPLGARARARPTVGLTVGLGRILGARLNGEPIVRQMSLADLRFSASGVTSARVASFDLANPDRAHRLNLEGDKKTTLLVLGALVVGGVLICWAAGCFDDDDDGDTSSGGSTTPTNPG